MFGNDSAQQASYAEAKVPSRKNAAVGSASLVVSCHVDKHVEEGRVEMPVAQSDKDGREVICHWMGNGHKEGEANE